VRSMTNAVRSREQDDVTRAFLRAPSTKNRSRPFQATVGSPCCPQRPSLLYSASRSKQLPLCDDASVEIDPSRSRATVELKALPRCAHQQAPHPRSRRNTRQSHEPPSPWAHAQSYCFGAAQQGALTWSGSSSGACLRRGQRCSRSILPGIPAQAAHLGRKSAHSPGESRWTISALRLSNPLTPA
jgi:hypothetical protein